MPNEPEQQEPQTSLGETIAALLRIVRKRRWLILLTSCCVTVAAIQVLQRIPNLYQSVATLLVVQQQVPQRYIAPDSRPVSQTAAFDSFRAMRLEVLSRRRLLAIIEDLGLYAKQRVTLAPEALAQLMTNNTAIEPVERRPQDFSSFTISFTHEDPVVAQKVTSTLTSLFIQENLKLREEQATSATNFLHEQVETKKKQLEEREAELREFKVRFLGELPEQQQGNLQILTGLHGQLQSTMSNLYRAQQQRAYIESLLAAHGNVGAVFTADAAAPARRAPMAGADPIEAARQELARLESQKIEALSRYTPRHPDVEKAVREHELAKAELDSLIRKAEATAAAAARVESSTAQPAPGRTAHSPQDASVAQLQGQLEGNRVEIENLSKEEAALKTSIKEYQERLNMTPVREQQLASLLSQIELMRQDYAGLQRKQQEAELARDLEKNQRGQQYRLIDAPSFPTGPSSPKRLPLTAAAVAGSLGLGLALAFVLELKNRSFHTETELRKQFPASLVLAVPLIFTPAEERARRWKHFGEWCAGSALVLAVLAVQWFALQQS